MAQATVEHPAEIVTLDGPVTHVTRSFLGWEKFAVPTTDGTGEIDAWIMRPEGFEPRRKYPVLLNVHGGPFTQYGETFFDEAQMQAAAGFVVRDVATRAAAAAGTRRGARRSSGPSTRSIPGTGWGTRRRRRRARRARRRPRPLPVLRPATASACSAAATAATWRRCSPAATATGSGRSAASGPSTTCCPRSGPATSARRSAPCTASTSSRTPTSTPAMSPIRDVRDIDVPMLIIHSENDLRCPIVQAEELFVALRLLGKDVTFYRFPGEGHELSRSRLAAAPPDARRDHPRLLHREAARQCASADRRRPRRR